MRALRLDGAGPGIADVPRPEPGPNDAVIRLRVGGVCATDLELVRGYMGFEGVLGHEFVGTVTFAAEPHWVGRRVVGEINCPCGVCPTCRAGRGNHCPHRTVLGIAGRDGAFSEEFTLPLANLLPVPDGVSDEAAVFVEPLAAALRVLEQVHVRPSDRVIVLGLGRLGLLCARVLQLTGAHVIGVGRRTEALETLPTGVDGLLLDDALGQLEVDVVVDCTGAPAGLAAATRLVRPTGTIVLKTTTHDLGDASPTSWVVDEVRVVGSRCGPFAPALRVLDAGLVDPTPLIKARLPLDQGVDALDLAARSGSIKVLVEP